MPKNATAGFCWAPFLCTMKYVTALEPTIALEGAHFQAAVFAFLQQAEEIGKKAQALCRGELTLEQALGESAQ